MGPKLFWLCLICLIVAGCHAHDSGGQVTAKRVNRSELYLKSGENDASAIRRIMKESGGSGIPAPGTSQGHR